MIQNIQARIIDIQNKIEKIKQDDDSLLNRKRIKDLQILLECNMNLLMSLSPNENHLHNN